MKKNDQICNLILLKLKPTSLYILLFVFTIMGCQDNIPISSQENEKITLECILKPGQDIEALVNSTNDFNNKFPITYPKEAILRLKVVNVPEVDVAFTYDDERQRYFIQKHSYNLEPNFTYRIEMYENSDAQQNGKIKVNAVTVIPRLLRFTEADITNVNKNPNDSYSFNMHFKDIAKTSQGAFYMVKALIRNNEGVLVPLSLLDCLEDALAVMHEPSDPFTFYLDANRFSERNFTLNFKTPEGLSDISSKHIVLQYSSLTEATYRYHIFKTKLSNSMEGGLSDPLTTFTNVKNGYGVFGAQTATIDSFAVVK